MSLGRKYANLPDVDESPDIYETPELVDDTSTVQTDALDSPEPSDAGDDRLDRQRIDRDTARRRFEPSLVNARDANFSDTIAAGERRSYKTRSRRRRQRDYDDDSDAGESDDESLSQRVARLRREAEEVRIQLAEQKEQADAGGGGQEQDNQEENDEMQQLEVLMSSLGPRLTAGVASKQEQTFLEALREKPHPTSRRSANDAEPGKHDGVPPSSTAAIAAFSDRLTALELALGLSAIDPSDQESSILPTIDKLSRQVSTLTSTLAPTPPSTSSTTPPALPNLEALSTRIKGLTAEADRLSSSRKAAVQSLSELNDARIRYNATRHARTHSRTGSSHQPNPLQSVENKEAGLHSELFLSEQSSKITALYQILPTITSLQPLLPVVLERLRSLNIIHAGAADARSELDESLKRQSEMTQDVARWREAVEAVEKQMAEMKGDMKENVQVVGGMVKDVEERVKALK